MQFIVNAITMLLDQMRDEGAEFPIQMVVLSRNGSLLFVTYTRGKNGGINADAKAEHQEADLFVLPVHLIFIDGIGVYRHAVLTTPDERPQFIN